MYKPLSVIGAEAASMRHQLESLAREQTVPALNQIIWIMTNAPLMSDRLKAAGMLLDRGYGKATEVHQITEESSGLVKIVREIVHVTKTREELEREEIAVEYREIENGNGHDR